MATKPAETPLDATVTIPQIASGVTERRVREESEHYSRELSKMNAHYRNSINALNNLFTVRVRAIANDPYVKLNEWPEVPNGMVQSPE